MSNTNPETLAALNTGNSGEISPEMIRTASNMIGKMSTEELQRMFEMASSFQGDNPGFKAGPDSFKPGSVPPNVTPDMLKTATDMMGKMSPEELQKMFETASHLRGNESFPMPTAPNTSASSSDGGSRNSVGRESSTVGETNIRGETSSHGTVSNSQSAPPPPSFPSSTTDLQEQMRNQMKDPAMRQVCPSIHFVTFTSSYFSCFVLSLNQRR